MTPRDVIREEAARLRANMPPDGLYGAAYERASQERRDAIDDALVYRVHRIAGPHLAGRPSYDVAASLIEGRRPIDLAPGLTRRQAAAWVAQEEHATPVAWLLAHIAEEHPEAADVRTSHVEVAQWLLRQLGSSRRDVLLAERTERHDGYVVEGRLIDRVDELVPRDLTTSVLGTFERAVTRIALTGWDGPDELIPEEPWMRRLPEGVTVLRHASALVREGQEQRHCVAQYIPKVASRECLVVSVRAPDGTRSTAEVVDGRVVQHRARANGPPSDACVQIIGSARWTY